MFGSTTKVQVNVLFLLCLLFTSCPVVKISHVNIFLASLQYCYCNTIVLHSGKYCMQPYFNTTRKSGKCFTSWNRFVFNYLSTITISTQYYFIDTDVYFFKALLNHLQFELYVYNLAWVKQSFQKVAS